MRSVVLIIFLSYLFNPAFSQQECGSAVYMDQLIRQNPRVRENLGSVETFTQRWVLSRRNMSAPTTQEPALHSIIRIPVVVHVIYNSAAQNISDAQIRSQIDVLNKDYRRQNADASNTPDIFKSVVADCEIEFALATIDPLGNSTNGIVRTHTSIYAFNIDDRVKSTANGGDDPWNPDAYLNIWVANLSSGILGYSSLPGAPRENDGVTIQYTAFGTTGTAQAPFNKGRTSTHEIGHWLNLIHLWGGTDCGNDHVDDTPPQKGPNRGCPGSVMKTCGNGTTGDMYMNFMDFTDDACMNSFTVGQRERMRSLFAQGGVRNAMLNSTAANSMGTAALAYAQIPDQQISGLHIYPNPATDWINIQISDSMALPAEIGIYNALGQKQISLRLNQRLQQVNVASLGKGVYYIKAGDGAQRQVARLLKL